MGASGITHMNVAFVMRCKGRARQPLVTRVAWNSPPGLMLNNGEWSFSTTFKDQDHRRYAISGMFSSSGAASGTLQVTSRNDRCATGSVTWSAAPAPSG